MRHAIAVHYAYSRQALEGKSPSMKGLGVGLGAAKRLMDEFHVETELGEGHKNHREEMEALSRVDQEQTSVTSTELASAIKLAVDEGLNILGESGKLSLHYHVERRFQLNHEQIHERIEEFHEALEGIFGAGAKVIERVIAKKLYETLGSYYDDVGRWTLVDYVT